MTKLTPALKKSILRDWQAMLPQFTSYGPMAMGRLVGPFVQGVSLDRDSSNATYLPTLHAHCLCQPFPSVSLSLRQPLLSARSGTVDRISVQFHGAKFREACNRLMSAALLPVAGDWTIDEVLEAHARYRRLEIADTRFPVKLMEDAVSMCAWLGKTDQALAQAARYLDEARGWPENVLQREGGLPGWKKTLLDLAESGDRLRRVVAEQIVEHKLQ